MLLSSSIYLGSSLLNKAVPFLLLPLLTSYLTPAEYGTIALFQMGVSLFIALYGGLHLNISRTYFKLDINKFSRLLTSIYLMLVSIWIFTTILTTLYYFAGGTTFGLPRNWLLAMPVIAAMGMANLLNLTLLRSQERPLQYARWEVSHSIINMGISYLLVAHVLLGADGRMLGISIAILVFGALGILRIIKTTPSTGHFSAEDTKQVIAISLPLIPHVLSSAAITSIDLVFIRNYLGENAVGIYSIGYQFGMVVMLFSDAFLKAWQPWFFKTMNKETLHSKIAIVKGIWKFSLILAVSAFAWGILATLMLPYVANIRYVDAMYLILPISLSYIFFGWYQIVFPFLVYAGRTSSMAYITPLAACINIGLNYLLIPKYGYSGAIIATALAYFFMFSVTFYAANKYVKMPWIAKNQHIA